MKPTYPLTWTEYDGPSGTEGVSSVMQLKTFSIIASYEIWREDLYRWTASIAITRGTRLQPIIVREFASKGDAIEYCKQHAGMLSKQVARAGFGWN